MKRRFQWIRDAHSHERDELSELTRLREAVDRNIIRIVNNMWSDLAVVFPEFQRLMDDLKSRTALALLERYAVPANMLKASVKELARVVGNASRNHFGKEFVEDLRKKAAETVGLPDDSCIFSFKIRENVKRLKSEMQELKRVDDEIRKRVADRKDVKLLDDMKGVSKVAATSAVSEIGDITQFETAEKLQAYGVDTHMVCLLQRGGDIQRIPDRTQRHMQRETESGRGEGIEAHVLSTSHLQDGNAQAYRF